MNRHHTGSGRRTVVPADWGANHATVSDGTRNAIVTLRRASTVAWSDVAEATVPTPGTAYATAQTARIQALVTRSDSDTEAAEETLTVPPYLVTVSYDLEPLDGDEVEVTACSGDPTLVGRFLRIDHVLRGTERFERDLFCTLIDVPPAS